MENLEQILKKRISNFGPISISDFILEANLNSKFGYYNKNLPFGNWIARYRMCRTPFNSAKMIRSSTTSKRNSENNTSGETSKNSSTVNIHLVWAACRYSHVFRKETTPPTAGSQESTPPLTSRSTSVVSKEPTGSPSTDAEWQYALPCRTL